MDYRSLDKMKGNEMAKINIDDYGKKEVYEKMSAIEILDVIDKHIKEQGNKMETDWTRNRREEIADGIDEETAKRNALLSLKTYIWQYGGACQKL